MTDAALSVESFAGRLKSARKSAKITQADLGALCGVSAQGVWNYENRGDDPASDILFAMADALGVDARWLATGQASPTGGIGITPEVLAIARAVACLEPRRKEAVATLLGVDFGGEEQHGR